MATQIRSTHENERQSLNSTISALETRCARLESELNQLKNLLSEFNIQEIKEKLENVSQAVRVNPDTNDIGVGTDEPETITGYGVIQVSGDDGGIFQAQTTGGTIRLRAYADSTGFGTVGTTTNHPLRFLTNNNTRATIGTAGNVTFSAIHNNASAGNISSGTYSPTHTSGANVAASTVYTARHVRIGNVVSVWGRSDIDPTAAAGTVTTLGISLPIASNFANSQQLSGVAICYDGTGGQQVALMNGDSANDRANLTFLSQDTANRIWFWHFSYEVI